MIRGVFIFMTQQLYVGKKPKKDGREISIKFLRYFCALKWEESQVVYGGNKRIYEEASLYILITLLMTA